MTSTINTAFSRQHQLRAPIIMAPMFLVSNVAMIVEAMKGGVVGTFPTLNFRDDAALTNALQTISKYKTDTNCAGTYGVNLIVQKTNIYFEQHLKICAAQKVPIYITSLGSPSQVVDAVKPYGAKVYSDVTNLAHARKAASTGIDGFIAVGQGAGGHAGPYPLSLLVPALKREFPHLQVIAAGGIGDGATMLSALACGADAVSIGTAFIASEEATVSQEYKNAIVDSGMENIVMTERVSGTPCNIIDTPYAKKIGYKQNWLERWLNTNATTKKYFKTLVQYKGMKNLEKAIKPGNYNNLWSAGQSAELVHSIKPCAQIIDDIINDTIAQMEILKQNF
ncbi:MAG: nitronate monooxygenase [Bacteroidetes bacterium]|nr:nitronate monooxygenase [Bacteroidota bacterium]